MLFQLFFCAAEQWHPVAINGKILANTFYKLEYDCKEKMTRKTNYHFCGIVFFSSIHLKIFLKNL